MKYYTVVKPNFRKGQEIFHVPGRHLGQEAEADRPLGGVQLGGVLLVGQVEALLNFLHLALEVGGHRTRSFRGGRSCSPPVPRAGYTPSGQRLFTRLPALSPSWE